MIILDPPHPATSWFAPMLFRETCLLRYCRPIRAFFTLFSDLAGTGRALLKHVVFKVMEIVPFTAPAKTSGEPYVVILTKVTATSVAYIELFGFNRL